MYFYGNLLNINYIHGFDTIFTFSFLFDGGNVQTSASTGKGKAVPLQASSGPEGSRKLGSQIS